mmetsp:Transcript_89047/g.174226  ORF Transcript_89047/g.174226 Transcript_89047/m.174226 type:complete len:122 (-) Transcript_89047:272-637(-)
MSMEENDADGDGKLSTQDVLKLFAPDDGEDSNTGLGSRQLEQLIADADMDNDGGLNIDELASFVATVAAQEGGVASLVAKSAEKAGTEVAEEEDDEENFDDGDFDDAKILVVENGAHARTS